MKVVGIGLNKTGTTTLGACLRHWGLNHISCDREAFDLWRAGKTDELLRWVERFDSFEDWPWPLIYREIDRAFPGTRFILTRRKDPDVWFRSLSKHAVRTGPTEYRRHIYGFEMPQRHEEEHLRFYRDHLAAVREYFRDRPGDLLEVCWEEGDGWRELAVFLGFEAPAIPFPHENRSPTAVDRVKGRAKRFLKRVLRRGI